MLNPKTKTSAPRGRPPVTGRFDTYIEMAEKVRFLYWDTDMSMAAIARNVKVSEGVVNKIVSRSFK